MNEIVVASESRLRVVREAGQTSVAKEARLASLGRGYSPVALATGYLQPYNNASRTQVVVVLTAAWKLLCYSADLALLWENSLQETYRAELQFTQAALLVTDRPAIQGDLGMVLVGGSQDGPSAQPADRHFSYYAFDGRTGQMRWRHAFGDFQPSQHEDAAADVMPEHSYKLHVFSRARHLGEVEWLDFRADVLQQLPHSWTRLADTRFTLAHFERQGVKGSGRSGPDEWQFPHREEEHVRHPNVLVAHVRAGLEVVHLYSGRMVTRLFLPHREDAVRVYTDLAGDRAIDVVEVEAVGAEHHVTASRLNGQGIWEYTVPGDGPVRAALHGGGNETTVCLAWANGHVQQFGAGGRRWAVRLPQQSPEVAWSEAGWVLAGAGVHVLDPADGSLKAVVPDSSGAPVAPLAIADFNNDRLFDIVVSYKDMYRTYSLVRQPSSALYPLVTAFLFAFGLLALYHVLPEENAHKKTSSFHTKLQ